MARRKTKRRLQHDRSILRRALEAYEAGAVAHLDENEQASLVEDITRRIADIDERLQALNGV